MKKFLGLVPTLASGWLLIHACGAPLPPGPAPVPEGVPPPPPVALTIESAEPLSLDRLVLHLAELSGCQVVIDEGVRERLATTPIPLTRDLTAEPLAAWPVVELLILEADCLLYETDTGWAVGSFMADPPNGASPRRVGLSELEEGFAEHPALYVELDLDYPPLYGSAYYSSHVYRDLGSTGVYRRITIVEPEEEPPRVRISGSASWVADRAALLVDLGATELEEEKQE